LKLSRRHRIALISTPFLKTPPDFYGGLELVVADLASALARLGNDVTVFAADGSKVQDCRVVEFGPPAWETSVPTNGFSGFEEERRAYHVYKNMLEEFDLVHGHTWYGFEYITKIKSRKLKVCHTHHSNIFFKQFGWDLRAFLRSGDYGPFLKDFFVTARVFDLNLIAISKWMAQVYEAQGFRSRWVHNGINLERYRFQEKKGDRLLFVGRIERKKQPHLSIQVAKRLNMGLDVVGSTIDADQPLYVEAIRKMCDGKQIRFYPDATQELKIRLMQNAKCLLFTSAWGEPFGLVPLEVMACGTPVVALNDGAIDEFVQEGGIICDVLKKKITSKDRIITIKHDPIDALAFAVKQIDPITPQYCLANAEKFSKEHMAECYLRLYNEILAGDKW
jgi:glycosyltransferase involved in cell wall biosynthesis